jgi:hypothetical protein
MQSMIVKMTAPEIHILISLAHLRGAYAITWPWRPSSVYDKNVEMIQPLVQQL